MSDPTGGPSALGIEAVEWSAQGAESIVLQVTGRWRRRRPTWSGQPTLVVEAQGTRHRFPAMPEPPSLTGVAPGTWRMSFSVPASLAPHLGGKAWLQLGAVVVSLPVDVESAPSAQPPADPGLLAQRRLRSYELAVEAARRRATQAEEATAQLNARIDQLELELDSLTLELAAHERARRSAEQSAHSERVLREELQEELAEQAGARADTEGTLEQLAEAETRLAELEAEIHALRRRADEAEQTAAAAQAARRRAERRSATADPGRPDRANGAQPADAARAAGIRTEVALAARTAVGAPGEAAIQALSAAPPIPAASPADARRLRQERALALARRSSGPGADLADQVGRASSAVPPRTAQAAPRLQSPPLRVAATLAELRQEMVELRAIAERESTAREQAQARAISLELLLAEQTVRCARAYDAIEDLRGALEAVRQGRAGAMPSDPVPRRAPAVAADHASSSRLYSVAPAASPVTGARIDPDRLATALERLREAAAEQAETDQAPSTLPPAEPGGAVSARSPEPAPRPWLTRAFVVLAERDATMAGRLALAMLPALRLSGPGPMALDLVLADVGCVQVDIGGGAPRIERTDYARPPGPGRVRVDGDLAGLGRLLAAGRLRRRLGGGMARWHGDRTAFKQLLAMVRTPVSLRGLHSAGMQPEPALSFWLAAVMIEPGWTAGDRFTIAHREPGPRGASTYLEVRNGASVAVPPLAPLRPVATTIVSSPQSLLLLLDGDETLGAELHGDPGPLARIQAWVKRAQSG